MGAPNTDRPVVVIGAGPVGLAAAAHLADRGIDFLVVESGDTVAASVARWGHVRLFSPWRYNTDTVARRLLGDTGWVEPDPDALPTGTTSSTPISPRSLAILPSRAGCGSARRWWASPGWATTGSVPPDASPRRSWCGSVPGPASWRSLRHGPSSTPPAPGRSPMSSAATGSWRSARRRP